MPNLRYLAGSLSDGAFPVLAEDRPQRRESIGAMFCAAGRWCRLDGNDANRFEESWAHLLGAKGCVATASGTTALFTSLNALGVGPGDEVIVPPYTFVATVNAVLALDQALPVFVDTERETFQIDPIVRLKRRSHLAPPP